MKKLVLTAMLAAMALPLMAQVQFYDPFNYSNGVSTNVSGGLWVRHSGTSGDSLVFNQRLQVFGTRTDDVNRSFPTNQSGMFAAFTENMSSLPTNPDGSYFAHFKDNGTFNFRARIFAVTDPNAPYNVTPGYYRIGVAYANGDASAPNVMGPSAVFPMDLALNTDYQVVLGYDNVLGEATVWVNPDPALASSDPGNPSSFSTDAFATGLTNGISALAFRQNSGQGQQTVDNVVVGINFSDVVTNVPASAPFFGVQPVGYTNYSGNPFTLSAAASGSGQLTYSWFNGATMVGSGSTYSVASAQASDSGTYTVVVTNAYGSVTSAPVTVSINGSLTAPFITGQPADVTNQVSKQVSFTVAAEGTGPLTYQWYFNDLSTPISGATSATYTIPQIDTNSAGSYFVVVTGGVAPTVQSRSAVLTVNPISSVSISFLRGLEDTNTWQASDTSTLWNITGVVINATNLTTGTTSSYYVQDATGGINLFITGTSAFRPQIGDQVTATGPLQSFNNALELSLISGNTFEPYTILSSGNALPLPVVLPFGKTNNVPYMEALEGSLAMLTNIYFVKGGGTNTFLHGTTYTVTNNVSQGFSVFIGSAQTNLDGLSIPKFVWTTTGALSQFLNATNQNHTAGYELILSRYQDLVTVPPAAVTAAATVTGADVNLTWNAQTNTYAYSVYGSTDVTGPYAPVATGLVFSTTAGQFTITNGASGPSMFYKISSP
jgi:hypothetical protein